MTTKGVRLVVDASVAMACGSDKPGANSPAPQCVAALQTLKDRGLRVAMSPRLKDEWKRHAGRFATKWLMTMIAKRQWTMSSEPWPDEPQVLAAAKERLSAKEYRAVEKDALLVSLAMGTDRRVLSLDDRQRALLGQLAHDVRDLQRLHWVNPARDDATTWLDGGARERPGLCIRATKPR